MKHLPASHWQIKAVVNNMKKILERDMQCLTCQGLKTDERGKECYDCQGTGLNLRTEDIAASNARQSKFYQEHENEPWNCTGEDEE